MIDPNAYPSRIAELLTLRAVAPLGPGVPEQGVRDQLAAIDDAAFGRVVDRDMAACCRAGLWLAFNFLDESHRISQDINTREGSYWHALMHRREPDHANAAYWFRRVGTHPIFEPLRNAAVEIATSFAGDNTFWTRETTWNPFTFNDLCERSERETTPCHGFCRRVQMAEWELLFAWCFDRATGRSG